MNVDWAWQATLNMSCGQFCCWVAIHIPTERKCPALQCLLWLLWPVSPCADWWRMHDWRQFTPFISPPLLLLCSVTSWSIGQPNGPEIISHLSYCIWHNTAEVKIKRIRNICAMCTLPILNSSLIFKLLYISLVNCYSYTFSILCSFSNDFILQASSIWTYCQ